MWRAWCLVLVIPMFVACGRADHSPEGLCGKMLELAKKDGGDVPDGKKGMPECVKEITEFKTHLPAAYEAFATVVHEAKTAEQGKAVFQSAKMLAKGSIGVLECDTYLLRMAACVRMTSDGAAAQGMEAGYRESIKAWKALGATPKGKETLAETCKAAGAAATQLCKW